MYRIHLSDFEGPLDLLLFFIKRDEIDIYDIPITHILNNYLEYVDAMRELDLEMASDFIYMASVLMSIKAKMLLPHPDGKGQDLDEFDPRAELVMKLLEYRRFKEMALSMQRLEEDRRLIFPRQTFESVEARVIDEDALHRPTLFDLIQAYRTAIEKMPKKTVHEIKRVPVTIEEQTDFILKALEEKVQLSFIETASRFTERIEIVVTFLAILEMAKNHLITIITQDDYNDFWISKAA